MSLNELQQTVDDWIKSYGVRYFNELTNTAVLMEEVGELARIMAVLYGEKSFKSPDDESSAKAQMADEMADILFVLTCLANQTGVNLQEAMQQNLAKKTERDRNRHIANERLKS